MLALSLDELFAYTEEERAKWHTWLLVHPEALEVRLQPDGRFATVGALIDHIFLVEARHLARLQRAAVPDASEVTPVTVESLFRYGAAVRLELRNFLQAFPDDVATTPRDFAVQSGTFRMTPRKLLFHVGLHETRHWAQIALGARQAGFVPPGNHDLFFSSALG